MALLRVLFFTCLILCLAANPSSAMQQQPLAAAGSVGGSGGSHGWTVIRAESLVPWALVHAPPRSSGGGKGASAEDGVARIAASLGSEPIAMAAVGNRVYMAFAVDTLGTNGKRRVLSVEAQRNPVSGLWITEPPGRFDAFESLPAEGELHMLASLIDGPMAVMTDPVPGGESLSLRLLFDGKWITILPPSEAVPPRSSTQWSAFADGEGCVLVGRRGTSLELWRTPRLFPEVAPNPTTSDASGTTADRPKQTSPEPVTSLLPVWSTREIISVPTALQPEASSNWAMLWHADELICGVNVAGSLRFVAWSDVGGWRDVAQIENVPNRAAVFEFRDCGRIAVLWTIPKKGETSGLMSGRVPLDREIHEISIATGRSMYSGAIKLAGPVSGADYRFVMIALLMVSATVLLFVLRPDETIPFQLPSGYYLAETPRRVMATALDFAWIFLITWQLLGHSIDDLSLSSEWRDHGPIVFFYTLAAACIINSLLEGLTGASLGKRILGCRVACGIAPNEPDEFRTPGISRALLRNMVKWGLPPLAIMGLIDPEGRGRADQLARTAVVVPTPPDEPLE